MKIIKPDFVLLGCPSAISGGPEAIHQLAQIINDLGVRAEIVYGNTDFKIKRHKLTYEPAVKDPVREEYARYSPIVARSVPLTERTLVILPEMHALMHKMFAPAGIAYWWLSWDNAFAKGSRLSDQALHAKFFGQRDILHLAQTFRAHICLREKGVRQILDLVDYTDPRFTTAKPVHPNPTFTIAYNPR